MPSLVAFVAEHFRDPIPAADGRSVAARCPVCDTDAALTVRYLGGCLSLCCTGTTPNGEPCPNTFADALGMTDDRLVALLDTVEPSDTDTDTDPDPDHGKGKRLSADDVVEWVLRRYRVGRSTDGLLFAVPKFSGVPRVAREVRSIRAEVVRRYRDETKADKGRGVVIGRETLTSALDAVSAYAEAEDPVPVFLRAAQIGDDRIVLDLRDNAGRVVEVSPRGWEVVEADDNTPDSRAALSSR